MVKGSKTPLNRFLGVRVIKYTLTPLKCLKSQNTASKKGETALLKINLEADINNIAYLDYMQRLEGVRINSQSPDIPEDEADNTGDTHTHTRIYV